MQALLAALMRSKGRIYVEESVFHSGVMLVFKDFTLAWMVAGALVFKTCLMRI